MVNYKEIIKKILGQNIKFRNFVILNNCGSGNIIKFQLKNNSKEYILKSYNEQKYIDKETKNLENINHIVILNKPKYFGKYKNFYIQEYIKGDLFRNLLDKLSPKKTDEYYLLAIDNLVKIHTAKNYIKDKRRLNRIFSPQSLRRRLEVALNMIKNNGLTSYAKIVDKVDQRWIEAIKKVKIDNLVKDLKIEKDNYFLGHGDYKPNNIIFTSNKKIFIIDWLGMSKAQPWYDLAYLLALNKIDKRFRFLKIYLDIMKEKGYLLKMSETKARKLFKSGIIFQQIIRAKSNSHLIKSKKDIHHIREFREAMNGLVKILEF